LHGRCGRLSVNTVNAPLFPSRIAVLLYRSLLLGKDQHCKQPTLLKYKRHSSLLHNMSKQRINWCRIYNRRRFSQETLACRQVHQTYWNTESGVVICSRGTYQQRSDTLFTTFAAASLSVARSPPARFSSTSSDRVAAGAGRGLACSALMCSHGR
jgi:hypothetical protein